MTRGLLIASAAAIAFAAFSVPTPADAARQCQKVTSKARGLSEKAATARSEKKLNGYVDRWAKKAGKTTVRISRIKTGCQKGKGPVTTCTSRAAACI